MNYPTENEVKKLGFVSRALAAFIFLCGLIAAAGVVYAVITEPLHPAIFFGALVIGALLIIVPNLLTTFIGLGIIAVPALYHGVSSRLRTSHTQE